MSPTKAMVLEFTPVSPEELTRIEGGEGLTLHTIPTQSPFKSAGPTNPTEPTLNEVLTKR